MDLKKAPSSDTTARGAIQRAIMAARDLNGRISTLSLWAKTAGETELSPQDRLQIETGLGRLCAGVPGLRQLLTADVDGQTVGDRLSELHHFDRVGICQISGGSFAEIVLTLGAMIRHEIGKVILSVEDFYELGANLYGPMPLNMDAVSGRWGAVRAAILCPGMRDANFDELEHSLFSEYRKADLAGRLAAESLAASLAPTAVIAPKPKEPSETPPSEWAFEAGRCSYRGKEIEINRKPLQVLRAAVENGGRITRTELLDKIWGDDAIIEPGSVRNHVLKVRNALRTCLNLAHDPFPCVDSGDNNTAWAISLDPPQEAISEKPKKNRRVTRTKR